MKAPERIYLIDQGDDGIVWCDDPNPAGEVEPPESVEYMRVPPRTGDWRDQIPWSALRPEVQWIWWSGVRGAWIGTPEEPLAAGGGYAPYRGYGCASLLWSLSGVAMPDPPTDWRESKVRRPEGV